MVKRSKTFFPLFLIFMGAITFSLGCVEDRQTKHIGSKDRSSLLRIAVGRDLYEGPDSRTYVHGSVNAWESLTYLNERLQPEGWLAGLWQMEDEGRKWIFHLREGIRFHDSTPLTPEAVVANISRYKNNQKYDPHGLYQDLQSIWSLGKRGVAFHLNAPQPNFPASINYFGSAIFHPDSFDSKRQFGKFIATGPYRFETNKDGVIRLKAHSAYWQGKPFFERVEFWFIPDASTRLNALKAGQVDAIVDVGGILPNQLPDLRRSRHILVRKREVATTHYLLFNPQRVPFKDISNRKWICDTLNRFELVKHVLGEAGLPAESLLTPLATDWYERNFPQRPTSSASYPSLSRAEVSILLHAGTLQRWPYKEMAEIIHAHLHQAGWKVKIRIEEAGRFRESLKKGDFDLVLHPFTLLTGEPDMFFTWLMTVSPEVLGIEMRKMRSKISKARTLLDREERKKIYHQLQRWVSDNYLILPLYHDVTFYAHRDHLHGLEIDAFFRPNLIKVKTNENIP